MAQYLRRAPVENRDHGSCNGVRADAAISIHLRREQWRENGTDSLEETFDRSPLATLADEQARLKDVDAAKVHRLDGALDLALHARIEHRGVGIGADRCDEHEVLHPGFLAPLRERDHRIHVDGAKRMLAAGGLDRRTEPAKRCVCMRERRQGIEIDNLVLRGNAGRTTTKRDDFVASIHEAADNATSDKAGTTRDKHLHLAWLSCATRAKARSAAANVAATAASSCAALTK